MKIRLILLYCKISRRKSRPATEREGGGGGVGGLLSKHPRLGYGTLQNVSHRGRNYDSTHTQRSQKFSNGMHSYEHSNNRSGGDVFLTFSGVGEELESSPPKTSGNIFTTTPGSSVSTDTTRNASSPVSVAGCCVPSDAPIAYCT